MKSVLTMGHTHALLAALTVAVAFGTRARPADAEPLERQQAAETVTVQLASGRTFTAAVDVRTDPQQLWLRWQYGSAAVLLRPIAWSQVVGVKAAGKELTGSEFLGVVTALRREFPVTASNAAGQTRIVLTGSCLAAGSPQAGERATTSDTALSSTPPQPLVRSLVIEAEVGRWNANVEADGLLVHVYPLDETGDMIPISGTLEVELIGRQSGGLKPADPFSTIGQWQQGVRPTDFGPRGAVYRLPFQSVQPEFDLNVAPHAAVHARLSVPAQGTFEATASMVRIRPYSSVRDELQQATGQRFFRQETTSDGRR
jgi:hypothetical protein